MDNSKTIVLVITLLSILAIIVDSCDQQDESSSGEYFSPANYDPEVYILALIAPDARVYKNITIHGLWPQYYKRTTNFRYYDEYGPIECKNPNYSPNIEQALAKLTNLKLQMQSKWVSRQAPAKPNDQFWYHEWVKHGMCGPNLGKADFAVGTYFNLAIKLYDRYIRLITDTVTAIGHQEMTVAKMVEFFAKKEHLGKKIEITCKNNVVYEINLCINMKVDVGQVENEIKNPKTNNILIDCNRNLNNGYAEDCASKVVKFA